VASGPMRTLARAAFTAPRRFRRIQKSLGALAAALVLAVTPSLASAGESGPTTMKLPATGLTIDLPTGWVARDTVFKVSNAPKGAPGTDLITRVAPAQPTLFFTLVSF